MFDKKKINFWRLAFIFTGIVVLTLVILWNSPQENKAQMMDKSMGNMMKQMHVDNITIYGLLKGPENQNQMNDMQSHHQNQSLGVVKLNFLSTALIFLLLPLIIGGAVTLAIVWIK